MNKDHYCSLEIAKKLKEAEIEFPESGNVWVFPTCYDEIKDKGRWSIKPRCQEWFKPCAHTKKLYWIVYPAPSLLEIIDLLPQEYAVGTPLEDEKKDEFFSEKYICRRWYDYANHAVWIVTQSDSAPDAAAKMLLKVRGEGEGQDEKV